jgi:acetyl-CoA synthetase
MAWETIKKSQHDLRVTPNLEDYDHTCADFSWDAVRRALDGLPAGAGLNIAHEAVDRYVAGPLSGRLALRFLSKRGETRDFTYRQLGSETSRFANVLRRLGVAKGERVFVLAGRIPELYIAALGTLKNGSVFCPLFSAFGPAPIRQRIAIGDGRVLVTTAALYRRKVEQLRSVLPGLRHVLLAGSSDEIRGLPGTLDYRLLMD